MVQMTYEAAIQCNDIHKVVVATDSEEIAKVITDVGGTVEMTDADIQTGSDRAAVVAKRYPEMDLIINLQGDEPFIKPTMLTELIQPYLDGEKPHMTTLGYPLDFETKYSDPNCVKVIYDKNGDAIYFSRSPLPYFQSDFRDVPVLHHIGLYAFTREFLETYTGLEQTPLEKSESLEQLRVLENGYNIRVCKTATSTLEINYPEDLKRAREIIE